MSEKTQSTSSSPLLSLAHVLGDEHEEDEEGEEQTASGDEDHHATIEVAALFLCLRWLMLEVGAVVGVGYFDDLVGNSVREFVHEAHGAIDEGSAFLSTQGDVQLDWLRYRVLVDEIRCDGERRDEEDGLRDTHHTGHAEQLEVSQIEVHPCTATKARETASQEERLNTPP